MAKLSGVELQSYLQASRDREKYPLAFVYPIRAKKSPASKAKLARKALVRARGFASHCRGERTIWHHVAVNEMNSINWFHHELTRIAQVEQACKNGTLRHPRLLLPLRENGSFAQWRHDLIQKAKFVVTRIREDINRSHGFLPG